MAAQCLTNLSLEETQKRYLKQIEENGFSPHTEVIPVPEASGRVTAHAVYARISAPHYPTAMEGIALDSRTTVHASRGAPVILSPDRFTMVFAGDPLPEGCGAVVMPEDVQWEKDGSISLKAPAIPWQYVRQVGEDICAGEMLLASHMRILPAAIGAMLTGGIREVEVLTHPVVGIIPTGDEILSPVQPPDCGDMRELSSFIFSSMLRSWDVEPKTYPIVPDEFSQMEEMVERALAECDIVLLSTGYSASRKDNSTRVIEKLGTVLYHGIAMKPGRPAILGCQAEKPILSVPGYPVSGILILEQLLKPVIDAWYQYTPMPETFQKGVLTRAMESDPSVREFIRVRMGKVGKKMMVFPLSKRSGVVSSFIKADGILEIPRGCSRYEAGDMVPVRLLRSPRELKHMLVAIGSHDPLLDELSDLLRLTEPKLFMHSSNTGSMGGIMAVRRGEAHMAGIHLLNEKDGVYNSSFVRKYFPKGGVRLVECVGRIQGLMVARGNPKQISGLASLAEPGIRYINRQKGAGTRILTDYLCRKEGIDTGAIRGYEREAFTHISAAAQIASGTADAGMGIYSAAKLYDLEFLPVCQEQYDLLIPDEAWETPLVQSMLAVLKGEAFRSRLEAMGGYELDRPGNVRERF